MKFVESLEDRRIQERQIYGALWQKMNLIKEMR